MNKKHISIIAMVFAIPFYAQADAVPELQAEYQSQGAGPYSAKAGEALWSTGCGASKKPTVPRRVWQLSFSLSTGFATSTLLDKNDGRTG